MKLDPEIKLAGVACEIVRTGGNLNTFIFHGSIGRVAGKYRGSPDDVYQAGYYLPTDCGAALGDLFLIDTEYYLLMSFEKIFDNGVLACYRGQLFKCNSIVSIYYYDESTRTPDQLHLSGIRCLITQVRARDIAEDKTYVINEYRGKQTPFGVYMQSSAGLTKESVIKDQDDRYFRVLRDFDPFVADGIIRTQVSLED